MKANHQLLNSSKTVEWYTPWWVMELVRAVMGEVDSDPASCGAGNRNVKAKVFYTKEEDGFDRYWSGRVFLNPPYGRGGASAWSEEWIHRTSYTVPIMTEGILLVNASIGERWFAPLWEFDLCFPYKRIKFIDQEGIENKCPTKGNCFAYWGKRPEKFQDVFSEIGRVVRR